MAALNFRELPVVQSEIRQITGSPQGVIYAPYGYLVTDDAGNVYVKQSDAEVNTGWKKLTFT